MMIFSSFYFGPVNCLLCVAYLMAIAKADAADVTTFAATKLLPTDKGFMYIPNLFYALSTVDQNSPFSLTPEIESRAYSFGILTFLRII